VSLAVARRRRNDAILRRRDGRESFILSAPRHHRAPEILMAYDDQPDNPILSVYSRRDAMQMNLAFARAMLAARKGGGERFIIGTFVDNSPMVPMHFEQESRRSCMSSSAALCSEMG
jgi:hypothetical protein